MPLAKSVKTGYRNPIAFCLALGAAYSASSALDMFFGALLKVYPFSPLSVPIFTWGGMAIALHVAARMVAVSVNWTRNPYLLLGGLATIAGVFGTHRYSLLVGFPLLLIGLTERASSKPAPLARAMQVSSLGHDPTRIEELVEALTDSRSVPLSETFDLTQMDVLKFFHEIPVQPWVVGLREQTSEPSEPPEPTANFSFVGAYAAYSLFSLGRQSVAARLSRLLEEEIPRIESTPVAVTYRGAGQAAQGQAWQVALSLIVLYRLGDPSYRALAERLRGSRHKLAVETTMGHCGFQSGLELGQLAGWLLGDRSFLSDDWLLGDREASQLNPGRDLGEPPEDSETEKPPDDDHTRRLIVDVLEETHWNQTEAARRLEVPLWMLQPVIKDLNIQAPPPKPYRFGRVYGYLQFALGLVTTVVALVEEPGASGAVLGLASAGMGLGLSEKKRWAIYLLLVVCGFGLLSVLAALVADKAVGPPVARVFGPLVVLPYFWKRREELNP